MKILLVDNNRVILTLLTRMLQRHGHDVKTAENGLSALTVLESYRPDVIFIDLIMPNISGDILCRIIRKKKKFDTIFLVILSAIAAEEQVDFISFGANACIAKGPAKEMEKHILSVLARIGKNKDLPFFSEILGLQNVYQREITKELLAKKNHFEITLENMGGAFLELTWSAKIVFANTIARLFFGAPEEELLSSNFIDYFAHEQRGYIEACLRELQETPVEIGEDYQLTLSDKSVLIKFVPVIEQEQKSIIVLINDITQRKQAEQKLNEYMSHLEKRVADRTEAYDRINKRLQEKISERIKINDELEFVARQWSTTFDTIPDFISIHDKNMKFVRVNRALATFLGKNPEELLGKICYEVLHNRKSPWPNCPHLKAINENKTITEVIDDTFIGFPLLVTCSPCFHDDGSLMGTVHVARDISLQKKTAAEQKALIIKKEQLKRFESLKTMAGAIAHRFNNSMMAVQGNLDLMTLTLHKDSEEYQMTLDAIQAARDASQVGSMMLSYVGQRSLKLENLSIVSLVKESTRTLKNLFYPGISLQLTEPDQLLYCSLDQLQCKEVIESILANSIESLKNGSGIIHITFGSEYCTASSFPVLFQDDNLLDGMFTFCQIKDSGHGISQENLLRIFEPFYTTHFVGRGLGLALTVGVMRLHHGAITVESIPDLGTTVRVLFPSLPSSRK